MNLIVYDDTSRLIKFTYDFPYPEGLEDMLDERNLSWITSDFDGQIQNYYVDDTGTLVPLHVIEAVWNKLTIENDGVDAVTITGLPATCEILVDGQLVHTGPSFTLTSLEEGVYDVNMRCPTYAPLNLKVNVV